MDDPTGTELQIRAELLRRERLLTKGAKERAELKRRIKKLKNLISVESGGAK